MVTYDPKVHSVRVLLLLYLGDRLQILPSAYVNFVMRDIFTTVCLPVY